MNLTELLAEMRRRQAVAEADYRRTGHDSFYGSARAFMSAADLLEAAMPDVDRIDTAFYTMKKVASDYQQKWRYTTPQEALRAAVQTLEEEFNKLGLPLSTNAEHAVELSKLGTPTNTETRT